MLEFLLLKDMILKREFLAQFLNKISKFPGWVKEIIYSKLSAEINSEDRLAYVFAQYKPILTYKGRCEHDFRKAGFDSNIYNFLDSADSNLSISDITLSTYLSLEEVAGYFLFCVDEGYFEIPDNSQIMSIAGFLAGKYKTGEYFVQSGAISENQLNSAVEKFENNKNNKKFGQVLVEIGLVSQQQLDTILKIKEDAKRRFVLDFNDVPNVSQNYSTEEEISNKQIEDLKKENKILKTKLEQLLTMVKRND